MNVRLFAISLLLTGLMIFDGCSSNPETSGVTEETNEAATVESSNSNADSVVNAAFIWNDSVGESENWQTHSITFPVSRGNSYDGDDFLGAVIDYCGGMCGFIVFESYFGEDVSFTALEYYIAGVDENNVPIAMDVSDWDGICVSYTSDFSLVVELGLGDSLNAILNDDLPQVNLGVSGNGKVVTRCAEWSEFKQMDSTNLSGKDASTQLVSIRFSFQGHPGAEGFIDIKSFGSLKGFVAKTYPDENWAQSSSSVSSSSSVLYSLSDLDTIADLYNGVSGLSKIKWYEVEDSTRGNGLVLWNWDSLYSSGDEWQEKVTENCNGMCGLTYMYHDYDSDSYYRYIGAGFTITDELRQSEGFCLAMDVSDVFYIAVRYADSSRSKLSVYKPFVNCYKWTDFSAGGSENAIAVEMTVHSDVGLKSFNFVGVGTYKDIPSGYLDDPEWDSLRDTLAYLELTQTRGDDICGDLFCGLETPVLKTIPRVHVRIEGVPGHDYDDYGQWVIFDDSTKSALITLPKTSMFTSEYLYDAYTQIDDVKMIRECNGLCGSYQIGDSGSEVGFGFHIGYSEYECDDDDVCIYVPDTVDVTPLVDGGFCFVYMSEANIRLQMVPGKQEVLLPKAPDGNLIDVKWSDFENGEEAAKNLVAMKFIFDGAPGNSGYFNMTSVGNLGSCKGVPDYSEKPKAQ